MNLLKKILKSFLGDKNERDIKEAKKYLEKIKIFEIKISKLSNDELRLKTIIFKKYLLEETKKISEEIFFLKNELKKKKLNKKNIYNIVNNDYEIDKIYECIKINKKKLYNTEQSILLNILPEAFSVVKETAKRFSKNLNIEVEATSFDKKLSVNKDYVKIFNNKAIWKNKWDAAGKSIVWDMIHYDVQLIGGVILHQGKIAEMSTGEGKTLVSTLSIYLNSLTKRGVHVVTINDYLSKRDSSWMAPIMEFHGLSVDCIDKYQPNTEKRRQAYFADITYGTNNEFGFDYLRDNMISSKEKSVQRELNYALIDEVDSVLIDEARTPLVISGPFLEKNCKEFNKLKPKIEKIVNQQKLELNKTLIDVKNLIKDKNIKKAGFKLLQVYRGFPKNKALIKFLSENNNRKILQNTEEEYIQDNNRKMPYVDEHLYFVIDEKNSTIELTDKGLDFLSKDISDPNFFIIRDISSEISDIESKELSKKEKNKEKEIILKDFYTKSDRLHVVNQLLKAYTIFEKDVDYVIIDKKVKIVDEQTGRIMDGRRYSKGLHQAIEAKENVKIEASSQTLASITLQNYFRMYNKLSGMTGTAETEANEFWEIYKLDVVTIPTNKKIIRKDYEDLVFKTKREKYNALIKEIFNLSQIKKRPVLVGTSSVEISELISRSLKIKKIHHNVLNAKFHEREANIIAEAGQESMVTIATNMAGRGTDIKLSKNAKNFGGLAILGTERYESRRIDRQLRGRSGRQGDPGSSQFFISLEDTLMRIFGSDRLAKIMDHLGHKEGDVIQHSLVTNSIERAQKRIEEKNFSIRKSLLQYDNIINKQREIIYKKRKNALLETGVVIYIILYNVINNIVIKNKKYSNFDNFKYEFKKYFSLDTTIKNEDFISLKEDDIINKIYKFIIDYYEEFKKDIKKEIINFITSIIQDFKSYPFDDIQIPYTDGIKNIFITIDIKNLKDSNISYEEKLIYEFEKSIIIFIIDEKWKEHLRNMDELRNSVQNSIYEQKDPLLIYKKESFNLFYQVINEINKEIIYFIFNSNLSKDIIKKYISSI